MSIFGAIKNAIFGHKAAAPAPAQPQAMPQMNKPQAAPAQAAPAAPAAAAQPAPAAQPVDVDAVLADLAARKGQKLNYESSIVDLMKLLDLDPSLANRQSLATELGYAGAKDGSAEMNIWLHKRVMEELEKNGGKVSAALKD
jgi:3-oxoacyl-ACP reductase-like protein